MAGSKHDADCLRRKEDPAMLYVCTCGLTDEQVKTPNREQLPDQSGPALVERTRKRMVELSIPAGADVFQLVERIGGEMAEIARLQAENERLREVLHTIAVDISKYETDSEGLIWRVKLAHETALTSDEDGAS